MVNRYCVHVRKSGAGSRPPDRERSEGKLHSRRRRSLFRHAGLAQAGEIRGFEDGLGLRLSCNHGPQSADARIAIVAAQSAGFGEFCGGAFALAFESVGRGEPGVGLRTLHRVCATRLFTGPDMQICRIRLSDKTSRLHPRRAASQLCQPYEPEVPVKVREWIAAALASSDFVLGSQPPAQPHGCVVVERPIRFSD